MASDEYQNGTFRYALAKAASTGQVLGALQYEREDGVKCRRRYVSDAWGKQIATPTRDIHSS